MAVEQQKGIPFVGCMFSPGSSVNREPMITRWTSTFLLLALSNLLLQPKCRKRSLGSVVHIKGFGWVIHDAKPWDWQLLILCKSVWKATFKTNSKMLLKSWTTILTSKKQWKIRIYPQFAARMNGDYKWIRFPLKSQIHHAKPSVSNFFALQCPSWQEVEDWRNPGIDDVCIGQVVFPGIILSEEFHVIWQQDLTIFETNDEQPSAWNLWQWCHLRAFQTRHWVYLVNNWSQNDFLADLSCL